MRVVVWLLDTAGAQVREMPWGVDARVRFQDGDGQWWHTSYLDGPQHVPAPGG
jgi:hypothetical protein